MVPRARSQQVLRYAIPAPGREFAKRQNVAFSPEAAGRLWAVNEGEADIHFDVSIVSV
jgi:hypothetical protein